LIVAVGFVGFMCFMYETLGKPLDPTYDAVCVYYHCTICNNI